MRDLCFFLSAVGGLVVVGVAAQAEPKEDSGYPVLLLVFFCALTVCLSAMYCGLTIGIMGMDAATLEIIAEAGPTPDCVYAANILPLRRLGHQLLVMFLLGNMLTLVVTSQLVAAIIKGSVLINFITSTSLILIFGEIIPMSICSNGKYALYLGSASIPALRLSLIVLYPISRPLGLLLDYLVPHEAGEIFDRAELKKLISLHSEKFAGQIGMGAEESQMIVSALELKESCVRDAMTPIEKVRMMESSTIINWNLEKTLWEWGKSRIPIYSGHRSNIVGLLYVKSLIGMFNKDCLKNHTLQDYLNENAVDIVAVNEGMSLLHALSVFEKNRIQVLFVTQKMIQGGTSLWSAENAVGESAPNEEVTESCYLIRKESMAKEDIPSDITGILTLEDVIEKLISQDILDEDECDTAEEREPNQDGDTYHHIPAPRVNFLSFAAPLPDEPPVALSTDQHWVLANFLSRTYVLFATWSIPHIMMLLHDVPDRVIYPDRCSALEKVLYTADQPSQLFTLLLSGGITVEYDSYIETEIRSFTSLGDEILGSGQSFIPRYTATVSRPSRVFSVSLSDLKRVEEQVNKMLLCHREPPISLLPSSEEIQMVEAVSVR